VFLLVFASVLIVAALLETVPADIPQRSIPLFLLITLGVPLLAAFLVGRWLNRKGWWAWWQAAVPRPWPRVLTVVLITGYVFTIVFGLPAVQTQTDSWAVSEYKRLKASGSVRVWPSHPYIATYLAVPVLPGLVLTYHEYQLDGLYGFGGFQLSLWYGTGVAEVASLPMWLS
jgi:hypothetical protein